MGAPMDNLYQNQTHQWFLSKCASVGMLEIPRMIIVVLMLAIASYHDVKTREIPDYIWILGTITGGVLYLFDWHETDLFVVFSMGIGGVIAIISWKFLPVGDADTLAIASISVVCPVVHEVIIVPIVVFVGGMILEHMAALCYNVRYNAEDLIKGKKIFADVKCSTVIKIMAVYSVHQRRAHERFTFCAEEIQNKNRVLTLKSPSLKSDYESRVGVFVTWAMPAFPFMLIALCVSYLVISKIIM